ncbi:MAG: hypothetical protein HYR91_02080 [Flavobacteriia bacterium]|nr:hypothetical protein [Flavobacteriia bacterium]
MRKNINKYFKILLLTQVILLACNNLYGQNSEDFIPKEAVTVFSLNNISLLQKVSMDELVRYEFMEEVQSELFDGSTSGKTLKDSGIDFDQKLNVFFGKGKDFEVSGFTFGIKNKQQLFATFDDFDQVESPIEGVEYYNSYFNHLIIKGNIGVLLRVDPTYEKIKNLADSIWISRGNELIYENGEYDIETNQEVLEEEEFQEDSTLIEKQDSENLEFNEPEYPVVVEDPGQKNYSELKDSISIIYQQEYLLEICHELFINNINLKQQDAKFAEQLTHQTEGIFYLDNSRNFKKAQGFWYFQSMFPSMYEEFNSLYTGNIMLGDLYLNNNNIELKLQANYSDALGSIYEKMNNTKFDKNVFKYIHEGNSAHFTYNVNLKEAYEQAYKIIIPILQSEKNARVSSTLLTLELLNEFVDKDALFGTYKGSVFGTFNGIKKVKTTKIEYTYDENYNYEEKVVELEVDMPLFAFGISTDREDIPEKILNHIARITSQCKKYGDYWKFENAILKSVPLYMINKNGLFIFTNDEDLAKNHANGYGKESLSGAIAKKNKKSGFAYAYVDWSKVIDKLPAEMFTAEQNDLLDAMRGKTGIMELTSSKTTIHNTNFDITYGFTGEYENSGKYILDLINSIYVISK